MPESPYAGESVSERSLLRCLTLPEAVLLGLGSIIGTGVFVSIGVAAGVAGPVVIVATAIAALLATANALNSAQLAASHPVSGGTYEYGYRYLSPWLGFSAGWMFLCAKLASAATAALGFAGYVANLAALDQSLIVPIAVAIVVAVTLLVLSGLRRSSQVNVAIVGITLLSLLVFCIAGLPSASRNGAENLRMFTGDDGMTAGTLLHATALMFVAYTGYGRIATLGEEVIDPRRTIPRAIVLTLIISAMLYLAVAFVAIASVGSERLAAATSEKAAPLAIVSQSFGTPGIASFIAVGAVTAMLGVLLNLLLGMSRVVLAMSRRNDLPAFLSHINAPTGTPGPAVLIVGLVVVGLAATGSVKTTWSFSAFTVLVYYAITNLAALFLPATDRLYPKWLAAAGLAICLLLAFFVEPPVWMAGLAVLAIGLGGHFLRQRFRRGH